MQVERTLFKVYERTLINVAMDSGLAPRTRGRRAWDPCCLLHYCFASLTIICLSIFLVAHNTYVGNPGCFQHQLMEIAVLNGYRADNYTGFFQQEDVFRLNVDWNSRNVTALLPDISFEKRIIHSELDSSIPGPDDPSYVEFRPDYVLSTSKEAVTMGQVPRAKHGYRVWNMTIPSACPGASALELLSYTGLVSYDTVIINAAMYSFPEWGGFIINAASGEVWDWGPVTHMESSVRSSTYRGYVMSFFFRVFIFFDAFIAFFIMSSVTAMFIRIFITSATVLLYPLFACLGRLSRTSMSWVMQDINTAYPWLGIPIRQLRASEERTSPFVWSHILFVVLAFFVFQGAAYLATALLYAWKSSPATLTTWLWALILVLEYLSLLFLRAQASIKLFPPAAFLYFVLFQGYYAIYPYGFSGWALQLLFTTLMFTFIYFVRCFEVPALRAGTLSYDKPREYVVRLSTPDFPWNLPPLWTIFHTLNYQLEGIYDGDVPPAQPNVVVHPSGVEEQGHPGGLGDGANGSSTDNETLERPAALPTAAEPRSGSRAEEILGRSLGPRQAGGASVGPDARTSLAERPLLEAGDYHDALLDEVENTAASSNGNGHADHATSTLVRR